MVDKKHIDVIFTELLNRYQGFFLHQIRLKFEGEEVYDVYQEFCIHLYQILSTKYSTDIDLFNTRSWLKAVVSNFSISMLRKKNKKRKVNLISEEKTSIARANYSDESYNTDQPKGEPDYFHAMSDVLLHLSKRDALMLKLKYYYGVPSARIARILNVAHVDVTIGRLKQRIIRKSGINDLDALLRTYPWLT
jgi:RNA polymerase sigma factor (sigma-70 family)